MVAIKSIHDWIGTPGALVSWSAAPASVAKMGKAPISPVPVSYQQTQHIRGFLQHRANGTDMARLNIPVWDMPGRCDIRAMTHVINAYVRRHDTYHSRFEIDGDDRVIRRTARSPRDIKFVPTEHGEMTAAQWREHVLSTPDPLQWDCFHFGIIQRADDFTFYISVDHVHTDAMFMGLVLVEIHMMYAALVNGAAPLQLPDAGSYDDYCVRQRDQLSTLTVESPEVRKWIRFAEHNGGTLPQFPLPLGDATSSGDVVTVRLLDRHQSERFESACVAAGARFIGGVFGCAALAQYELTGSRDYHVITPTTTRRTPAEFMTTGWFTGTVPISIPVDPVSFNDTARAAQAAFDSGQPLAHVPFDRVRELCGDMVGLRAPEPGVPMLSYLDAGLPPLSPSIIAQWEALNGKVYTDTRSAYQVGMYVNRSDRETTITVTFPNNPIARESIDRYLHAMKSVYARVADGRAALAPVTDVAHRSDALRHTDSRGELVPVVGA
jgi:mycolipenoyl-CoA---2-(long-chain-fatty acyl)-trehalose mycolipenoyltransferase / long-chain-acyl-CoA---trehalose acyltransferase